MSICELLREVDVVAIVVIVVEVVVEDGQVDRVFMLAQQFRFRLEAVGAEVVGARTSQMATTDRLAQLQLLVVEVILGKAGRHHHIRVARTDLGLERIGSLIMVDRWWWTHQVLTGHRRLVRILQQVILVGRRQWRVDGTRIAANGHHHLVVLLLTAATTATRDMSWSIGSSLLLLLLIVITLIVVSMLFGCPPEGTTGVEIVQRGRGRRRSGRSVPMTSFITSLTLLLSIIDVRA